MPLLGSAINAHVIRADFASLADVDKHAVLQAVAVVSTVTLETPSRTSAGRSWKCYNMPH